MTSIDIETLLTIIYVLVDIALRIHETNTDKGNTKIAGLLTVVACKDTQSTGIDRQ